MTETNFNGCKFAADIVPYMYGEMAASAASGFESHLLECGTCTDEFAVISSARYEVYDWKKQEFDLLPTPAFSIPSEERSASFIEKLRAVFGRPWAVPGLAFAAVALASVLTVTVYLSGDPEPTIASSGNSNAPSAAPESPTVATPKQQVESAPVAMDRTASTTKPQVARTAVTRTEPSTRVVKRTAVQPVPAKPVERFAQERRAPRLNEFNDEEDTSLRLAQLFDDIDTSD